MSITFLPRRGTRRTLWITQLLHCKPQQRKRKKLSFTQNTNGSCFPKAKQIGHRLSLQISCLLQMERKFSWRHHICLGTTTFRIHVSVFGNQNSRRRPVVCPGNPQEQELVGQVAIRGKVANITELTKVGKNQLNFATATIVNQTGTILIDLSETHINDVIKGHSYQMSCLVVYVWSWRKKLSTTLKTQIKANNKEKVQTKKSSKKTVMIRDYCHHKVWRVSQMSEMHEKDSANYMLKNCKVPQMQNHKGRKVSSGPFPHSKSRNHREGAVTSFDWWNTCINFKTRGVAKSTIAFSFTQFVFNVENDNCKHFKIRLLYFLFRVTVIMHDKRTLSGW